ncbi:MAG: hypothetical protein ACOYBR_01165 [Fluviibacter sp.]
MRLTTLFTIPTLLVGCTAQTQTPLLEAKQVETQKITLGAVQGQLHEGSSSAEVIAALGSPSIVASNPDKTETWVYDKTFTETEISASGINLPFSGSVSGARAKSSRSLIVTIKFNRQKNC